MKLTPELRKKLKLPLGKIIPDLEEFNPSGEVISIGDIATGEILKRGIKPRLCIYDARVMRAPVGISKTIRSFDVEEIMVRNPPGEITQEAFQGVKEALSMDSEVKIHVQGEEDLLALVAIKFAKLGSTVIYGQPDLGLVVVDVTKDKKEEVDKILKEMVE